MGYMFQVGDVVRVRDDLVGGEHYVMISGGSNYETFFNPKMEKYRGVESVVTQVDYSGYSLKGIPGWVFSDTMLDSEELTPAVEVNEKDLFSLIGGGA